MEELHEYSNNALAEARTTTIKPVDLVFRPSFFSSDSAHHQFKGF